ncbi:hypothetical protein ACFQX8_14300 [Klenkia terrae]|uniref:hypothetical protein n=1 Tax=Klenkia terrae TaxID=1052259 RepID=UPI00360F690F
MATALGLAGIDIVSVDVLERGGGVAVDDIVVELPEDRVADGLITAVMTVPGVQVESLRPFSGQLDTHRELELLESLGRAGGGTATLLADELPRVLHGGWAVVLTGTPDDVTVLAASEAAPGWPTWCCPGCRCGRRCCCPARPTGCRPCGRTWPWR